MPPKKLGKFKTIKIQCLEGHEVARYRKPLNESGHRTHKLWLLEERIGRLSTKPPLLKLDTKTQESVLDVPETGTAIMCGGEDCTLKIGQIGMVGGTVALVLEETSLRPTRG
jgi:hypothetical protein